MVLEGPKFNIFPWRQACAIKRMWCFQMYVSASNSLPEPPALIWEGSRNDAVSTSLPSSSCCCHSVLPVSACSLCPPARSMEVEMLGMPLHTHHPEQRRHILVSFATTLPIHIKMCWQASSQFFKVKVPVYSLVCTVRIFIPTVFFALISCVSITIIVWQTIIFNTHSVYKVIYYICTYYLFTSIGSIQAIG